MKPTVTYRTKLTRVDGDLKATVTAKHLPSGLAAISRPLSSENEAKAEAQATLMLNLKALEARTYSASQLENRSQPHAIESL